MPPFFGTMGKYALTPAQRSFMTASEHEKMLFGESAEILQRDEDALIVRIHEGGTALISCCHVFPGIDLIYYEADLMRCRPGIPAGRNTIEFCHCREGRAEREINGEYLYLTPGDFSVARSEDRNGLLSFPLGFYRGIAITVDTDLSPRCLSCFLNGVDVDPCALADRFLDGRSCFLMRGSSSIEHIFSELYTIPESTRKGYLKVKVLELFLFLSGMDPGSVVSERRPVPAAQVRLAKDINNYLGAHMDSRTTIEELSELFHASPTQIKNSIKGVYGMSVYAFARSQKMHAAAHLLTHSDATVLDIAGRFGYDNGSKFAKAFRDVIGMSPVEYRSKKE